MIKIGEYDVIKTLGIESSNTVFLAERAGSKKLYAIKLILHKEYTEEIDILKELYDIEGVVKYVEHFIFKRKLIIVTEYINGMELYDYILKYGPIEKPMAMYLFKQICRIMLDVHSRGIAHRDLKPENIIIDDADNITILDWGMAFYPDKTKERKACGSPYYAAPELLDREYYNQEVDIWSMGVIFYTLLTAHMPFDSETIQGVFKCIRTCKVEYGDENLDDETELLLRLIFVRENRIKLNELIEFI